MLCSDSDSDSGSAAAAAGKKEFIFTTKKDAVEAFKNLLRDKASGAVAFVCRCRRTSFTYVLWTFCQYL